MVRLFLMFILFHSYGYLSTYLPKNKIKEMIQEKKRKLYIVILLVHGAKGVKNTFYFLPKQCTYPN